MNENLTPQIVAALLQDGTVKMTGQEIAAAIADAIGALDKPYRFRGVATPGLAPGKIFEPTLYVAVASATYGPFSNQSVDKGQIVFFTSDDGAFWSDVVAYCGGNGCPETPGPDPALSEYFTIEAEEQATVKFYRSAYGESYGDFKVEASTDGGQTWNEVTATADGAVVASLAAGEKVLLRGTNQCYGYIDEGDYMNLANFHSDGQCYVYGNIMSLMGGADFSELREVPAGGFTYFFSDYDEERTGEWVLSKAGKELLLPATTLAEECYAAMFSGCTSMTAAPALPATTLAARCYGDMFSNCTSLTSAPELPATTLAVECYGNMFSVCTSLTSAPELPATTLAEGCYAYMFSGCTSLEQVTCLATDISATEATTAWIDDVAATGTFRKAAGVNWPTGENGIPTGWTVIEA